MTQTDIINELRKYSRLWKALSQSIPQDKKTAQIIRAACQDLDTLIAQIEHTQEGKTP